MAAASSSCRLLGSFPCFVGGFGRLIRRPSWRTRRGKTNVTSASSPVQAATAIDARVPALSARSMPARLYPPSGPGLGTHELAVRSPRR